MTLTPQKIDALYKEAVTLQGSCHYNASLSPLRKIVTQIPHHFPALHLLGNALAKTNKPKEGIPYLKESLKHCPEYYPAAILLSTILYRDFSHYNEAETILLNVKEQHPDLPEIYRNLSDFYMQTDRIEEARVYITHFLTLQEKHNETTDSPVDLWEQKLIGALSINPALDSIASEASELARLNKGLDELLKQGVQSKDIPQRLISTVFYLSYYDVNPRTYLEKISAVYRHIYPELTWTNPRLSKTNRVIKKKIRIGVVSTYLDKLHPIGYCFAPLIKAFDREEFELIYFRLPITKTQCPSVNLKDKLGRLRCIDMPLDIPKARTLIANEDVDILWYTDICMETFTYFLAHSRLAPIQCVSTGHPTTTGIATIDYYISGEVLENDNAQDFYSEKLIKLPSFTIIYEDIAALPAQKSRADFKLPEHKNLYFCPQTPFKIHPKMDALFKGILEGDAAGILVFSYPDSAISKNMIRRFEKSLGALNTRCLFIPYVTRDDFYRLLNCMDVILDTFPVSGGNTSFQGISVGAPIITMAAQDLRSSTTSALYNIMGLDECIARSPEEYIKKSVKVATDKRYKDQLSEKILKNKHLVFQEEKTISDAYINLFKSVYRMQSDAFESSQYKDVI